MPGADGRGAEEGLGTGFLPSDSRSSGGLLLPSEENPSAPSGEKPFRSGADPNSSRRYLYRKPVHQKWALGGRTAENRWSVHLKRAPGGRMGAGEGGRAAGGVQKQKRLRGGAFSYPEPGSNRHSHYSHWCLRPARLPIPPSGRCGDRYALSTSCKSSNNFDNSKVLYLCLLSFPL